MGFESKKRSVNLSKADSISHVVNEILRNLKKFHLFLIIAGV